MITKLTTSAYSSLLLNKNTINSPLCINNSWRYCSIIFIYSFMHIRYFTGASAKPGHADHSVTLCVIGLEPYLT